MSDDWDDDDDLTGSEEEMTDAQVHRTVMLAVGELLNIASIAAELQTTDEGADEIYNMCDLVAAYFEIERTEMVTEENEDGSFTVRPQAVPVSPVRTRTSNIPGVIRTMGKPKLRLVDKDDGRDLKDMGDDDDDEGPQ